VRRRGRVGLHGRRERTAPVATCGRSADPEGHGAEDDQPDQGDRKGERPASAARCNAQRRANAGGPVWGDLGHRRKRITMFLLLHLVPVRKRRTERRYRISEWVNGPKTYCLGTVTRVHLHT